MLKQYDKALDHHQRALRLAREMGDKQLESRQTANLGIVYRDMGEWQLAIEHLQSGLAIQREIGDQQALGSRGDLK